MEAKIVHHGVTMEGLGLRHDGETLAAHVQDIAHQIAERAIQHANSVETATLEVTILT